MPKKRHSADATTAASPARGRGKRAKMAGPSDKTSTAAEAAAAAAAAIAAAPIASAVDAVVTHLAARPKLPPGCQDQNLPTPAPKGFYQTGSSNVPVPAVQQSLGRLFDQYRDNPKDAPDKIGIDGAQSYLTDLAIELDEIAHLALCDFLQCPSIGEFDREPFISGWRGVSTADKPFDTPARQADYVAVLRKKLAADPAYFRQVYRNAFQLAKPEGQRSVPMDSAIDFWNMFFRRGKGGLEWNSSSTAWLDLWIDFYESRVKRPVNKDLWNMVGELVVKTKEPQGESLAWWKEDGAWPMAVDDFVAFVKEKRSAAADTDTMDTS